MFDHIMNACENDYDWFCAVQHMGRSTFQTMRIINIWTKVSLCHHFMCYEALWKSYMLTAKKNTFKWDTKKAGLIATVRSVQSWDTLFYHFITMCFRKKIPSCRVMSLSCDNPFLSQLGGVFCFHFLTTLVLLHINLVVAYIECLVKNWRKSTEKWNSGDRKICTDEGFETGFITGAFQWDRKPHQHI